MILARLTPAPALALALVCATGWLALAPNSGTAATGATAPGTTLPPLPTQLTRGVAPTNRVPVPPEARIGGAPWDSLAQYERAGRWAVSDSVSTALVRALESASPVDSLALSRALFYYANSRLLRRQYADGRAFASLAQAMNIRARRTKPTDPLLIWGHVKAATLYSEAGHPDSARAHGEIGLGLLESMSPTDTSMLAQAHLALATSLIALGADAEARPHFEAALRFREQADRGEGILLVPILADYGGALSRAGEIDRARAVLQRAVMISERFPARTTDYLANSLGRLSSFENRVGNVGESLALARRAYEQSRLLGESSIQALRARTVVAYRLQECGDPSGAALLLREILPGFEKSLGPNHPQTINARLSYIQSLVALGDTAAAARELEAARPAVALQDRRTNNNWMFWQTLSGSLEGLRGNHAAARDSIQLAIDSERLRHDPLGAREADVLGGYLDNVRGPEDRESLDRAVTGIDRLRDSTLAPTSGEWHRLVQARAAAEARVGLRDSAWAHALEAERMSRERLAYQMEALSDLRGLQLARITGGASDLVVGLARPDHADELEIAWDRVVRRRGIVGREVARRRAPLAASADTALASAYGRWIASQRLLAQLVVSGAAHPGDPKSEALYTSARAAADAAEGAYALAARGRVAPDSAVGLARVRASLRPGQALVSFAFGNDGSGEATLGAFVAVAGSKRAQWISFGSADPLDDLLRPWIEGLGRPPSDAADATRSERTCRDLGARVHDRIWNPIAHAAGDAREILIVPEGPVIDLPWHALPTSRRSYLAESPLRVRVLWSERDLVPPIAAAPVASGLLALGDPAFDRTPVSAGTTPPALAPALRAPAAPCIGSSGWALPALPGARAEAEGIARSWTEGRARLLLGEEADESRFKLEAPGKAVLHVATHGIMVQDTCRAAATLDTRGVGGLDAIPAKAKPAKGKKSRPRTSVAPSRPTLEQPWLERQVWLALVGANRPFDSSTDENEGLLTAEEVVTLDLRGTDWVVLSACHSGYAQAWAREGVLGMRRAFRLAGAGSVIASRWAVADASTREWMSELYAARARGAHAAAASSEASRAALTRRRAEQRTTHPFYWAAFSSIGE